jgi:hypothetical protein
MKKLVSAVTAAVLGLVGLGLSVQPASASPTWVDFDSSPTAPYVGDVGQFSDDISEMHSIGGKYYFFRGPNLYMFNPLTPSTPPALQATTPTRSKINNVTGVANPSYVYQNLILYTGLTSGVWAYDTTNSTSYEIKAGANSLRHMRDFTIFNGAGVFLAQQQGAAVGTGWGIYSVDLSARAGSPEVYSATLRKATSFSVNAYSGFSGFAKTANLMFYADSHNTDGASVWVMDSQWDAEALVDLNGTSNTQAGHMVAYNGKLGFKARTSNNQTDQAQYFVLDISGITTTTVDGTPSLLNQSSPQLTRLMATGNVNLDVQQAAGIAGRYILIHTQIDSQVYSYDTVTGVTTELVASGFAGAPMRPYVVGGNELAILSVGSQIRTYNPANGHFGVQVAALGDYLASSSAYDFTVADTNADGNSDIAAFGVRDWNNQRWFHAPVSAFMANAAYKQVEFDNNGGTGSMAAQLASASTNLTANTFTNTGFVFSGWNTQANGSGTSYVDAASFPFTADTTLYAQWAVPAAAPEPYSGPVFETFSTQTVDTCSPTTVTVGGSNLQGVTATVNGVAVKILETSATKVVMQVPAGLTPAAKVDLVVTSSSGKLTVQDAFEIKAGVCVLNISEGLWTKKLDSKTIKFYAKSPIGEGKIQFFANGKEVAWVNAVDETDPKLTFASGYPYLVRTFDLVPGKNRVEIRLDGERVWRATYANKG